MRRAFLFLALLYAGVAEAQGQRTYVRQYDLDTPSIAATTNRIVASTNLLANSSAYTIAAQPDVPRNITITVTDTTPSVVAGTITITGTDVDDAAQTEALNLATALTLTGSKVFKTVSTVTTAGVTVLGGVGDEVFIVGVGSTVSYIYCVTSEDIRGTVNIKTTGSSTTVTAVSGEPFVGVGIGDELLASVGGGSIERRIVTAVASSTSVTVDSAASWSNSSAGYQYSWRDRVCGYSSTDGWINVRERPDPEVKIELLGAGAALTATGGIDVSVECRQSGDGTLPVQVLYVNFTSTAFPNNGDLLQVTEGCSSLRVGLKFGTVDTTGTDSVSAYLAWRANR